MKLQYEISTTGQDQIRRVLRGVEQEAAASDRRLSQQRTANARRGAKAQAAVMFGPGQREYVAAERLRHRQALANTKAEERAKVQAERNLQRAREQLDRQRSRALFQQHKSEERARRQLGERISGGVATSGRRAVGTVARVGGAALGIAGGFAAAEALREESDVQRRASELANQAGTPELKGQLAKESGNVSGFSRAETLSALSAFVTPTGDLDTGRKVSGSMGKLALATGAEFEDLMATAGLTFNVLSDQISDPVKRLDELNRLMGVFAQQGALGAVEIKDLAQDFAGLGAATRGFEGGAPDLLRTMGAFAQIAVKRGGARGSAEASTAAMRLASDIVTPANKKRFDALLGPGKLKSKTDPTKLRDPLSIMLDVLDKTGGDIEKTSGLFGIESAKIFKGLAATYSEAEKKQKGSGRKAVETEFNRFAKAELSDSDRDKRASSRLEDPDLQFKEAMKAFNTAVGSELLPAVTKLIPSFTQLVPVMGDAAREGAKLVGWFAENPFRGVGAIVAASVAKDVASAGISAVLSNATSSYVASLAAGELAMMKFAGAAGFAAVAIYAAHDQNEALKKETGGLGMGDLAWGSLTQGTTDARGNWHGKSFFSQVDDNLNEQAKEEAKKRMLQPPGFGASDAVAKGATPTPSAPGGAPATPTGAEAPATQAAAQAVTKGGSDLQGAAKALTEAATALKANSGAGKGKDPSRSLPIVAPERG
jgi:hypothetical protein